MQNHWRSLALIGLLAAFISAPAFAQGTSTSSLAGTVVDAGGGAVPGATITARNNATGATFNTVSSGTGDFTIPAMPIGTYTVTVSLSGFKTVILNDVVLSVSVQANVRPVLEVGQVEETVNVTAAGTIVQTQQTNISSTISTREIANTPLVSRNVLDFVTSLPGVNTPGGNRQSTVNGLPRSSLNITLDGINVQDNTLKHNDGFFTIVNPRLDAIEEVTVSGAANTADAAGSGAVQIKFVTRSGSNSYTGSGYWYYRSDTLNANTWFNERDGVDKAKLQQNQPGFRVGGPIYIPGLFDGRNRAFFFVNYEEFRQPRELTRTRTILSPEAQQGLFRYAGGAVDLFQLAAATGIVSAPDPVTRQLLADIRAAASSTGSIDDLADPNLQRFRFNVQATSRFQFPTTRVDWNLSENHRFSGSFNYQLFLSEPDTLNGRDPRFPGFPVTATQASTRVGVSTSLRSTLSGNIVNELRIGGSGAPVKFFDEMNVGMFDGPLANQAGLWLRISAAGITDASTSSNKQSRNAYTFLVEDTLNWQRGNHGLNIGGSYTEVRVWLKTQNLVPDVRFGVLTGDPALAVFSAAANFPGSSSADRTRARNLYATLAGSVSNIFAVANVDPSTNRFEYLGERLQEGRLGDLGLWVQDAWRPRPDLTLNLGLRWEMQTPFRSLNASYSSTTLEDAWGISGLAPSCTDMSNINPRDCNVFRPGLEPGKAITEFFPYEEGRKAYNMDWNNLAPSVGAAWTPSSDRGGWLSSFLGQPGDTVFRAGWSRAFQRQGMSSFTGRLDDNPGLFISANRTLGLGNLGPLPVLLRQPETLGPPAFQTERIYPMTDVVTGVAGLFDPDIQVPFADTWSAGWQRALSRHMALEVRYVGTRGRDLWRTYNLNEENILENGLFDEFRNAQQNLQANLAAGRGANFRYFGPGTGTSPLPIMLAYFSGLPAALSGDAARYTSGNFASSTYVNPLAAFNPNPFSWASNLNDNATLRNRALAAGLPSNFIVANPNKLGGVRVTGNGDATYYHSLQMVLRRRMANGLQFNTNYTFGRAYQSDYYGLRVHDARNLFFSLDTGSPGNVTHAIKGNWVYELPIGQGRRFATNAGGVLDRIVGGWQVHGTFGFRSGASVNFGNVRMVGFDKNDLKDMYFFRKDADNRVTMLPEDVIENSIKAFSVSAGSLTGYGAQGPPEGRYFAPANGPDCIETIDNSFGDCGTRVLEIDGPWVKNVDMSIVKIVPLAGRVRAEFRAELLNAFNWVNFSPVTGVGSTTGTGYEVTGLTGATTARIVQLVGRVSW